MRLAVLSDIHGNLLALEAVLENLKQAGGTDHTWILGDLAASGPRPAECLKIVEAMQAASPKTVEVIGGNTDRYLVTGQRPRHTVEKEEDWPQYSKTLNERDSGFAWTLQRLKWDDYQYLKKIIRRELELEIPGYGWAIGFHGGPGNDEQSLSPDLPDDVLTDSLYDREGRLAFCGHTHTAMDRDLGRWRLVNVGSIGLPNDERRACYALVTFEGDQASIELRRVSFDSEAVIRDAEQSGYPAAEFLARLLRTGKAE